MSRQLHQEAHENTPAKRRTDTAGPAQQAHPLLGLQRHVGNAQIARLLAQRSEEEALQRQPEDEEDLQMLRDPNVQRQPEDEEDMQMLRDPNVQRQPEDEEDLQMLRDPNVQRQPEDEEDVQMLRAVQPSAEVGFEGGPVSSGTASEIDGRRGSGAVLDSGIRNTMESALETDLSDVRVHSDSTSHNLNQRLGAQAFTTGSDIFLGQGSSSSNQSLMAHELTHVVQQRSMSASGPMEVTPGDDSYEQEAESVAKNVTGRGAAGA